MNESLAIIPARGGSKRIPQKNIKEFMGAPIIKYSIDAAIKSRCFDEIMVSTDDEKIAKVAKSCGAKIPFLRSAETSNSTANIFNVLEEVILSYKKQGKEFDSFCCILATAPFISEQKIKEGFDLLRKNKVDQVISVVRYGFPIQRAFKISSNRVKMIWPENMHKHSQNLDVSYHDSGQFHWFNTKSFLKQKKSFLDNAIALELPEDQVQDIDTMDDWKMAELKYRVMMNII
jgi:N-acylneuraminate cytidylyltransferase